jgi:predicted regulator of Ras-like GTPase activity (Roadblock/LC7/MglB family)
MSTKESGKKMDSEVYSFALKTTLTEIQNICPEIKNCFIFKEDGGIIAKDEDTSKEVAEQVLDSFNRIMKDAKSIGGIEGLTLEGSKSRVDISLMSDVYLFTITSQKADMAHLNTLTRVLVPTILKLLDKINPASLKWGQGEKISTLPLFPLWRYR